jgi:hypothetical protein
MNNIDKTKKLGSVSDLSRRRLLKTAGATSVLAASGIAFPALTGFAKEFKGV